MLHTINNETRLVQRNLSILHSFYNEKKELQSILYILHILHIDQCAVSMLPETLTLLFENKTDCAVQPVLSLEKDAFCSQMYAEAVGLNMANICCQTFCCCLKL